MDLLCASCETLASWLNVLLKPSVSLAVRWVADRISSQGSRVLELTCRGYSAKQHLPYMFLLSQKQHEPRGAAHCPREFCVRNGCHFSCLLYVSNCLLAVILSSDASVCMEVMAIAPFQASLSYPALLTYACLLSLWVTFNLWNRQLCSDSDQPKRRK